MSKETDASEHLESIKMEGFDIEFGQLPTVASNLAFYDLEKVSNEDLRALVRKSRNSRRSSGFE